MKAVLKIDLEEMKRLVPEGSDPVATTRSILATYFTRLGMAVNKGGLDGAIEGMKAFSEPLIMNPNHVEVGRLVIDIGVGDLDQGKAAKHKLF